MRMLRLLCMQKFAPFLCRRSSIFYSKSIQINTSVQAAHLDFLQLSHTLKKKLILVKNTLKHTKQIEKLSQLRDIASSDQFFNNPTYASTVLQQIHALESIQKHFKTSQNQFLSNKELYQLAYDEMEFDILNECIDNMQKTLSDIDQLQKELLLHDEQDVSSCYLEIIAGAGGKDSCDWVSILSRMYQRWAQHRNYTIQIIDSSPGDVGLRSICIRLDGYLSYGYMKLEVGVHRLVRISPFDVQKRRHTSFAQIRVYPVQANKKVEILPKDLRIDTFRSTGAGGQHVNTTDSAVRITHLPTGIVVQCQSDRSQHRNKSEAMNILQARLYERELERQRSDRLKYTTAMGENSFGNQIRSYVLQPYKMVKDHRSRYSVHDVQDVLDGNKSLERFMEEALACKYWAEAENVKDPA